MLFYLVINLDRTGAAIPAYAHQDEQQEEAVWVRAISDAFVHLAAVAEQMRGTREKSGDRRPSGRLLLLADGRQMSTILS